MFHRPALLLPSPSPIAPANRWWMRVVIVLLGATLCGIVSAGDLVLAKQGVTEYQLVLPDTPASQEIDAALQQCARLMQAAWKANGADLTIVREAEREQNRPGLYLGDTALARRAGIDSATFAGWSYVLHVSGRDVMIVGADRPGPTVATVEGAQVFPRLGTAKGVVDFLREFAGTRFLYPDVPGRTSIAALGTTNFLQSPAMEFVPVPAITVPDDLNRSINPVLAFNIEWAQSLGFYDLALNRFPPINDAFSGHTWARAVPFAKYYQSHPEYFALINGQRQVGLDTPVPQYCISNPEVQELLYQDLIYWLDHGYDTVDLGQPDGFRPCQCADCKALFGTGDDWSEKLWLLDRQLAERVLKSHPGKQVTLMSYILTARPPKSFKAFPANTRVMLCSTDDADFTDWEGWDVPGGFTAYLYNSTPNLGTRYTPMRTPRFVESQAKRLVRNHVRGISRDGLGYLFGLEGPVYYTMGRMFDDVEHMQAQRAMNEFCTAAFGKSAPNMQRFYNRLYHGIELYSEFLGTHDPAWVYQDIYGGNHKYLSDPFQLLGFLYPPALLNELESDLAQSERTVTGAREKARLGLVRREFNYLKSLVRVVHLYRGYEIQPDMTSRDRLLAAIDDRNAEIDSYYADRGTRPVAGWPFAFFPPNGHSTLNLRLAYDGYQEPMKDTCLNWNTATMRLLGVPGGKRYAVKSADGAVKIDSPLWNEKPVATLASVAGKSAPGSQTTVRLVRDAANLYLRFECDLPAAAQPEADPREALVVYLTPQGLDLSYRFTVGLKPEAKADAASGFVTDVMDPRFGQYDVDWRHGRPGVAPTAGADWQYDSRFEPAQNRWLAMLTIPFSTLGVNWPSFGTIWRANVGRVHPVGPGPDEVERSSWSNAAGSASLDNRNAFGEILFDDNGSAMADLAIAGGGEAGESVAPAAAKTSLQAWREAYNGETSEIPATWKKLANPFPKPFGPWTFRADPREVGVKENWFAEKVDGAGWSPIKVPGFWGESRGAEDVIGYAWYRTTFSLPAAWQGQGVRLLFAAVDDQAWVYVNGKQVREHSERTEGKAFHELWETPFTATVPASLLRYDAPNVLVVRVCTSDVRGGIWRPVLGQALDKK